MALKYPNVGYSLSAIADPLKMRLRKQAILQYYYARNGENKYMPTIDNLKNMSINKKEVQQSC